MKQETDSPTVPSTTLCGALVDKDGHKLRSFCITVPGPYPTSPDTPAPEADSAKEATQGESPRPPAAG
jgi:hypothetical protein